MTTAYIITHCRSEQDVPTNLLTINTVRVGYPNARVVVVDNASPPHIQQALRERAADFEFIAMPHAVHEGTLRAIIQRHADSDSPVVILDADVLFWSSCEGWEIDGLYAGRLIPMFRDEYSDTVTHPRLHTSHLVIPQPDRLAFAMARHESERINLDLLSPVTVLNNGRWERYDTTSLLYAALGEQAQAFTESQLDSFDHVFCGSSLDIVAPHLGEDGTELVRLHEAACREPELIRGIWRWQEEFFAARSVDEASPSS